MKRFRFNYVQLIILGFAAFILIGALLLCLPAASRDGRAVPFIDALFTSTSATCVTGLVIADTLTCWSTFGQIVILALIQIGGLGVMTVFALFALLSGKQIGLRNRMYLMQAAGSIELAGVVRMIRLILLGTLIIESSGALLLAIPFVRDYGAAGIFKAVFTSISAFCNAGFDLLGTGESLVGYESDPLVMIPIMLLIITGGIGFLVWTDVVKNGLRFRKYTLHSKIVLSVTGVLLFAGAGLFFLFERNGVLQGMNLGEAWLQSFFLSVTPRTAGFASVRYADVSEASWLLTLFLMMVGGAPGSTAGGIKVTTFAILILDAFASAKQSNQITAFKRRLDEKLVKQAVAVCTVYAGLVLAGSLLLCAFQPLSARDVLLEVISAASTVGLSTGITASLIPFSKCTVVLLMFGGRVGGTTLALLIASKRTPPPVDRPTEKILIG